VHEHDLGKRQQRGSYPPEWHSGQAATHVGDRVVSVVVGGGSAEGEAPATSATTAIISRRFASGTCSQGTALSERVS
jgi:hypothetical protein